MTYLVIPRTDAQQLLQIEKINSLETIKIGVGSRLIFKASIYSDEWQRGIIQSIDYESQTVFFDHTFLTVDQIDKIKIPNPTAQSFAWMLKGFGVSWLIFGAIIDLADLNEEKALDIQNISIGLFSIGTGFLIDKASGTKVYSNRRTHRFRIIDLRFSDKE